MNNLLYIGSAGVGKSRFIIENFANREDVLICSPTGMSASGLDAPTINSLFCLGFKGDMKTEDSLRQMNSAKRKKIRNAAIIVIDEVYVVPEKIMIAVNKLVCAVCGAPEGSLFANKRVICFGDHAQLPCIEGIPFVNSELGKMLNFTIHELQQSPKSRLTEGYANVLRYLRVPRKPAELKVFVETLKQHCAKEFIADAVTIAFRNEDVEAQNARMYTRFDAIEYEAGERKYKTNMPIMITSNDIKQGFFNGMLCEMISYSSDGRLTVRKMIRGQDNVNSSIILSREHTNDWVLAFAITIHKSQGSTLPAVNIIIREADYTFDNATNLLYVALSRVRSPKNIFITHQLIP